MKKSNAISDSILTIVISHVVVTNLKEPDLVHPQQMTLDDAPSVTYGVLQHHPPRPPHFPPPQQEKEETLLTRIRLTCVERMRKWLDVGALVTCRWGGCVIPCSELVTEKWMTMTPILQK
jgi:hypothetical protein